MGDSTHTIPLDVLNDICSRFITNLPDGHRNDHIRLCFHIELAYWFYLDFKVEECNLKRCSIREFMLHVFQVLEETGFDVGKMIKEEVFFENVIHEQINRLYIVTGVPLNTKFKTQTRNEITDVQWHNVGDLPPCKMEAHTGKIKDMMLVRPFVKQLRKWIDMQRKSQPEKRTRHKSQGDMETVRKSDASRRTKSQHQVQMTEMIDLNDLAVRHAAISPHKNKKEHRSRSRNKSGDKHTEGSACKTYANGNKQQVNGTKQQRTECNNAKQGKQRSEGGNGKRNGRHRTESEKQLAEPVNGTEVNTKQTKQRGKKTPVFWSKEWEGFTFDREEIYKLLDECLS